MQITDQRAATLRSLSDAAPPFEPQAVCRRLLRAPAHAERISEGGLRLSGRYKRDQEGAPLVTIITVVRNASDTFEQCLLSVLAQTYDNLEYIVVDGASSDGTVAIIERYAEVIDYYVSEPDEGLYEAMNMGLALASGSYVLLLNADDWYEANTVSLLVNAAVSSGADICHADATLIDGRDRVCGRLNGWLHDGIYTCGNPLRHETMLVPRTVYERIGGYDTTYPIIADYVYVIALYDAGCSFHHVPRPLLNFRMTGISNSARARLESELGRLFQLQFPFLDSEDLAVLNLEEITNRERIALLEKHRGRDERFTRSLACNIAFSPEQKIAERVIATRRRFQETVWWRWSAPLRRVFNRWIESGGQGN